MCGLKHYILQATKQLLPAVPLVQRHLLGSLLKQGSLLLVRLLEKLLWLPVFLLIRLSLLEKSHCREGGSGGRLCPR